MRRITLRGLLFCFTILYALAFIYQLTGCSSEEPPYRAAKSQTKEHILINTPDHWIERATQEYMQRCYRHEYWYCTPPEQHLPNPIPTNTSIWRSIHVTDVCTGEEISVGECKIVFECDPTQFHLKEEECYDDNGLPGIKKVYCDKGFIRESECISLCIEETCDGVDDDCDGETDEGQLNDCGFCGPTDEEICDGLDNDCNGMIDDDLVRACSTECGTGFEFCYGGMWQGCTAQDKSDEVCDGIDNDCNGLVDDGLVCTCALDELGAYTPCVGPPLQCGSGYKKCQCVDESCTDMEIIGCYPLCYFMPEAFPDEECDLINGKIENETCNNWDDNCNQLIDEDLTRTCYSGPPGTENVGICAVGKQYCKNGAWGNDNSIGFLPDFCLGEVLPSSYDSCNGIDDDCDGVVDDDKEMQDTDVVFLVDWSGSMSEEIEATVEALTSFTLYFSDESVIKWSFITAPYGYLAQAKLTMQTNLTDFNTFYSKISSLAITSTSGGSEMLFDAIYLSIYDIADPNSLYYNKGELAWYGVPSSNPNLWDWSLNWRPDSNKVIIVFTDESGQSYMKPKISQEHVKDAISGTPKLSVYVFSPEAIKKYFVEGQVYGWLSIAQASEQGKWFELTDDVNSMYNDLMQIIDENVCGQSP